MRIKLSSLALSLTACAFGIGYVAFTALAAAKNDGQTTPAITCLAETPTPGYKPLCHKRGRRDICHFGKVEQVKGANPHIRYNVFCEPTCIDSETTCWVTGLPPTLTSAPYTINWLGGKKPTNIYRHDLAGDFAGSLLVEATFTRH